MKAPYNDILSWLDSLSSENAFFRKKAPPSLLEINRALDWLGRPDKSFKYRIIIGGTAGKGSVCRSIEQTLVKEGISVLHLSSPHLQVVNERIRLNGQLISDEDFVNILLPLRDLIIKQKLFLTYYEVLVLAGILWGQQKSADILLCEVGLGGEFDAVNAVQGPRLCGLTFIGSDHLEILGPTLENVAETKSKIFTQDSVFNCSYEQNFGSILQKNSHLKIRFIKGIKQKLNKKLARNILEQIISSKSFLVPQAKLPCRWEKVGDSIRLDGAHSEVRFQYLKETKLRKQKDPYTLILGMQQRHEIDSLKLLLPFADTIIWTESGEADCYTAQDLKKHHGLGFLEPDPIKALRVAQTYPAPILVTGSFYLCGRVRERFYPSALIRSQQTEWPDLNLE